MRKKRQIKGKKYITQWILQNILENQTIQRIVKFAMVDIYDMVFAKGTSKRRWDVQYFEVC